MEPQLILERSLHFVFKLTRFVKLKLLYPGESNLNEWSWTMMKFSRNIYCISGF